MKIGWLGGSFDPVHNAHLKLARAALTQLQLDKIYLVLSPRSPFKSKQVQINLRDRLSMLKLALRGEKNISVGSFELKRKGISYTVNSLRAYKKKHPSDQIFLILGSDAWNGFSRWKDPEEILSLASVVVARRPGVRLKQIKRFEKPRILAGAFPYLSSTALRKKLTRIGLKPAVFRYIQRHHLYEN